MGRTPHPRTRIYDLEILDDYYQRHQVKQPNGCITWDAGMHRQGYGMVGAWRVSDGTKIMTTVHRIAARIKYGRAIASNEMVLHTCSNMACCNPDHLIVGTREDMTEIMRKNRRYRPLGRDSYQDRR